MKKLIFFLTLLSLSCLSCSTASAFEDTVERYPTGALTDYWTNSPWSTPLPIVETYQSTQNHVLQFSRSSLAETTEYIYTDYAAFTLRNLTATSPYTYGTVELYIGLTNASGSYYVINKVLSQTVNRTYSLNESMFEMVSTGGILYVYQDGVLVNSFGAAPGDPCKLKLISKVQNDNSMTVSMCIDDISTESIIGSPETYDEYANDIWFSYRAQAFHSYPESNYSISLYSLTADNAGVIYTEKLDTACGYIQLDREDYLGENFGLYLIELTQDNAILYDTYFYYYQATNPVELPEILFRATSDVKADIFDEAGIGDEINSGEYVYLYPNVTDNSYNITYDILELPYSIKTQLNEVYASSTPPNTTVSYTGLSGQNYIISVNGASAGNTTGSDTWSTFLPWNTTSYIISFAPDYSLPGVWGEVKNSETQEGIKSATVSITGNNFSKTVYTDDNGLYYYTKNMSAGQIYTITASKTGYSAAPSQTAETITSATTRQDFYLDKIATTTEGSGLYYAPHNVGFTVLEYWYSGAGLTGVNYAIYNGTESLKTGTTDSKGMFTGSDLSGGTNYTIILTHNGTTYTEYIEPSLTEYTFVLNKEGILHQYANSWLTLSYTENTNNVTIAYTSNKTLTGASLTAIAGNGTTVYTQTLNTATGTFTFETGGEGDYTLNFHIEATDGNTASQSWGLSYPDKIPLFPDSYPAWLKNILFSGIVMVFLLAFGKSKNDIACGAVAILTSMGYIFGWFTGSFYFVVLVWIIALGAVFLHYKRTGGIG